MDAPDPQLSSSTSSPTRPARRPRGSRSRSRRSSPSRRSSIVRHPRAESVADLQLAVERMKGRRAVAIYTLVEPTLRATMRTLCRRARLHYCDLLAQPLEAVAKVSGRAATMTPAGAAAARRELLPPRRGDRVRGQERRRARARARRRRGRARRRLAHLEDAALDLPRLPRLEGDERPARQGDRAARASSSRSTRRASSG